MRYTKPMSFYRGVLDSARQRHEQGHYNEAIILLQTGVELFTEQTFDQLCHKRQIEYLQPQLERLLFNNYNLGHDKVVSLYEALSEDKLRQAPFWTDFKRHVELRNDIVHQGREATQDESQASIRAVEQLIDHICSQP
jgi:hypothetical protein